ncbi:hypothetical protein FACS18945_5840 [Bacteroidia bacterium]|nr:hypothetical protein FACS18945_5840 [Bacteroidia bacterium]
MKKSCFMFLVSCFLSACIKPAEMSPQAAALQKLESVSGTCALVHTITTEHALYNSTDADAFMRNRVAESSGRGNAFHIKEQSVRRNDGAVFGPTETFVAVVEVYECK